MTVTQFKSDFLQTLSARGFLHQATDAAALDAACVKGPITAYIGFDCTAESLHAGSLLPIMMLRHLQKTGHKPIVLMGGGTSRIGDPSFKDEARQLLDDAQIAKNMAGIKQVFEKYLAFGSRATDAVMVNNADWLDQLKYIDFLRDVGRHFSVNRMLSMDSVKLRLDREQSLSFLEFNYMILQGYDFYELFRRQNCILQMGGSDQWGNIVMGTDLVHKMLGKSAFGLTSPLLTTSAGGKMGKTASGAIWLNREKLDPYDFWQYWRNTDDADVGRFLRLFTELPLDEIARLEKLQGVELNDAKKILADEATKLCHGAADAQAARQKAESTFEQGKPPEVALSKSQLASGLPLYEVLIQLGWAQSKSEGRRLIAGGGIKLGEEPVKDELFAINSNSIPKDGVKLSAGKKKHAVLVVGE